MAGGTSYEGVGLMVFTIHIVIISFFVTLLVLGISHNFTSFSKISLEIPSNLKASSLSAARHLSG